MTQIVRITLFKLPNPDVLDQALQKYSTLAQDALKVCHDYSASLPPHTC